MIDLDKLMEAVELWEGTPYRTGGNSLQGVDCVRYCLKLYQSAGALPPKLEIKPLQIRRKNPIQALLNSLQLETTEPGIPGTLFIWENLDGRPHLGIEIPGGVTHAVNHSGVLVQTQFPKPDFTYWVYGFNLGASLFEVDKNLMERLPRANL